MKRTLTLLSAAALLAVPVAEAQARPTRAQTSAAIKARQNAMDDFSARMSRLDAQKGVPRAGSARARSAEAGR